jgi:hypothetical protein
VKPFSPKQHGRANEERLLVDEFDDECDPPGLPVKEMKDFLNGNSTSGPSRAI